MQFRESYPLLFHPTSQHTCGHLGLWRVGSHTVTWAWRSGWNLSSPRDHTHRGNRAHSKECCTGIQAGLPGRQEMKPWPFEVSLWNLPCLLPRLMGSRPYLAQTQLFSSPAQLFALYLGAGQGLPGFLEEVLAKWAFQKLVLKLTLRERISDTVGGTFFRQVRTCLLTAGLLRAFGILMLLIHRKKTIRGCASPRLIVGDPLWSVAPLPILGAGVARNTVWEMLSWGHDLCFELLTPSLRVPPLTCVQVCPSPLFF